jgi:hypothetical protein
MLPDHLLPSVLPFLSVCQNEPRASCARRPPPDQRPAALESWPCPHSCAHVDSDSFSDARGPGPHAQYHREAARQDPVSRTAAQLSGFDTGTGTATCTSAVVGCTVRAF